MRTLVRLLLIPAILVAQPSVKREKPRLVIVISIDQMKSEYFDWYGKNFTGGLARLKKEGIFYSGAMLDYASSETGPGHATLSTGSFPRTHGILGNEWIDPKTRKNVYCVSDSLAKPVDGLGGGVSSRNLLVPAFGDWVKTSIKGSKVVSLSVKDRAAILMGGKKPDQVYWYDRKTAKMVTSSPYVSSIAPWVKAFNDSNWVFKNVPPVWSKVLPDSLYLGPDTVKGEQEWDGSTAFPHMFNLANRKEQMLTSPWGDLMILDAARAAIKGENLGADNTTDVLMLSLSCTDYVGHAYGGNSHEMQDHLARLDGALGQFLADVERIVDRKHLVVALSADHACMQLPEYRQNVEFTFARRLNLKAEIYPRIALLDSTLRLRYHATRPLVSTDGFINYDELKAVKADARDFERRLRDGLMAIDGIADVYFKRELVDTTGPKRPYLDRYRRSYYAPRGEDVLVRFCEYCLPTSGKTGTSHGSAYDYDNHVPVLFWGPAYKIDRISRPVHSVDVVVTLASMLGVKPPKTVNGVPLTEALQK